MPSKLSFSPTEAISYPDIKIGLPAVLLSFELLIISIMHLFAFSWHPYRRSLEGGVYKSNSGGFLGIRALIDALNVWDLVKAFGRGIRWLFVGRRYRGEDPAYDVILRRERSGLELGAHSASTPEEESAPVNS